MVHSSSESGDGQMSDSIEYIAMKACFSDLTNALELHYQAVLNKLIAQGLISPSNAPSSAQRLAELLLEIVQVARERYNDILIIFSGFSGMEDLVHSLKSEYSKLCIDQGNLI